MTDDKPRPHQIPQWTEAPEPPPHELAWVGTYLAALGDLDGRAPTASEIAVIDRVSRWLITRGLSQ